LIAFDKYRHNSAEAGAKYILTALFSSALLLFGLSMIYGSAGTLYFDDLPAHIDGNPLQIMAFVFFFTGMAFKLSLVPFHLWTADVYEGAPSTVTAYLSVVSKGSAAICIADYPHQGICSYDKRLAGSALLGNDSFHHHREYIRYPPTEPETSDGIL